MSCICLHCLCKEEDCTCDDPVYSEDLDVGDDKERQKEFWTTSLYDDSNDFVAWHYENDPKVSSLIIQDDRQEYLDAMARVWESLRDGRISLDQLNRGLDWVNLDE